MMQLTQVATPSLNLQDDYKPNQNNGQVWHAIESGETMTYDYDALKRLIGVTSSGGTPWAAGYRYDGFGNLTAKDYNAIHIGLAVDPTNNNRVNNYKIRRDAGSRKKSAGRRRTVRGTGSGSQ